MALLHDSVAFKKMDVRIVERNIKKGVLSPTELDSALKSLPDDAENAEWVNTDSLLHDPDEQEMNGLASQHQH